MARRVGFGDGGRTRPAPSDPRFRKPLLKALTGSKARPIVWIVMGFLGFWLVGWTAAIAVALNTVIADPGGEPFLWVWLAFALLAEAFALWVLIMIVRGLRARTGRQE